MLPRSPSSAHPPRSPTKSLPPLLRYRRSAPLPNYSRATLANLGQGLVQLTLIKKLFLGSEQTRANNAKLAAIRSIYTKNTESTRTSAEVKIPRLHSKPARVRQQPNRKRIFERLFHVPRSQRTIPLERRILPVELHRERLNGLAPPIHGIYNVITHIPGEQSRRIYVVNTRMSASFSRTASQFSPGSLALSNDLKQDFFDSLWRNLSFNAII